MDIDWKQVARFVLLSRELDELEEKQLVPDKNPRADLMVKYQFSASGHELAQVLLALALDHKYDAANPYYRSRPFMLASGLTPREALASGMARAGSMSEGHDIGVSFNMPRRKRAVALPMSGDVGSQYAPAAGWAQAIQYRARVLKEKDWDGAIAVACGGDGSIAANGFWAALNIATTLKLPMLFFIEDNAYGISVPSNLQTANGNIAANLAAFGNLKVLDGDGTEPRDASEKISDAIQHARAGKGPALLRLRVPRLKGHTYGEDARAYKSDAQIAEEKTRDPLPRLKNFLVPQRLSEAEWQGILSDAREELSQALSDVEKNPLPNPRDAAKNVFFNGAAPAHGGLRAENALRAIESAAPQPSGARINLLDAIRKTLQIEMQKNLRVLIFGEDVGPRGGVHRVTLGLQNEFGAARVFDTSLNEEGIMGRAQGMALAGLLPVPEIQFRKYADPATEQINDIGSLRWRTAGKFAAPIVARIPVGFTQKIFGALGDPWHSISGEAIYAHTIGWRVAMPSNAEDAVGLLRTALRGDDPTIFLEHRALLDTEPARRAYPGDDYCLPFGIANVLTRGDDLTVVTWG
ncbi:MAG: pyruvate dehydrogenase, partial [Chloroflexi bacterium]|nr:pyruvate dehydrogenase [Chloroflexota bacterium]